MKIANSTGTFYQAPFCKSLGVTILFPITKGWSGDKKYCVTKADRTKYLLRIMPFEQYETRKFKFEMQKQVAALGIPMCIPMEFGICEGYDGNSAVYSLESWIDGEDLESVLPMLTETDQYILGLNAGKIQHKMHIIPAPDTQEEWADYFNRKTDEKIIKYRERGFHFEGDEIVIAYLEKNRSLLKNRPQYFKHRDYCVGNIMFENGELKIIDFNMSNFGDPWEEFTSIVWSAMVSPHFATGQLQGYFNGDPPLEFFKLLAFYLAYHALTIVSGPIASSQSEFDKMMKLATDIPCWFGNMQNPIPTWYLKDWKDSAAE